MQVPPYEPAATVSSHHANTGVSSDVDVEGWVALREPAGWKSLAPGLRASGWNLRATELDSAAVDWGCVLEKSRPAEQFMSMRLLFVILEEFQYDLLWVDGLLWAIVDGIDRLFPAHSPGSALSDAD